MRKSVVRVTVVLLAALVMLMSGPPIFAQEASPAAQENRAIAFFPEDTGQGTFITVELNPGESAEPVIILGNAGDIEQTLRTYAIPVNTGVNGGFVLADYGTENDEITSWVDYPEQTFTFAPTEGVTIRVVISVPEGTAPGEYVTGLAVEQDETFDVPGTDMIRQRVRWSIPILIVVPGDRAPAFELMDSTLEQRDSFMIAEIGVVNTGNVTLRPIGEIRLLDSEGTVIGVANVQLDSVYSLTDTTFIVAWENTSPSEVYSVEANLTAEEGTVSSSMVFEDLVPVRDGEASAANSDPVQISQAEFSSVTDDVPPSLFMFRGAVSNTGEPIENARVSIVTYQDGVEVDRYPILQAVTIQTGETPVEARYSLPGGFTDGTYTFEVTIELGSSGTQTVLVTQPIDFEVMVGD